jgi:plastocyanin
MKKLILMVVVGTLMVLAGCGAVGNAQGNSGGGTAAGTATVNMNAINFAPNNSTVTIKAGQAVTFVDPAAGGLHYLLTGTNGRLTPAAGAPAALSTPTGMLINAGDTKVITFANAGKFMITCTLHPYMELTVVVTA